MAGITGIIILNYFKNKKVHRITMLCTFLFFEKEKLNIITVIYLFLPFSSLAQKNLFQP